jgi:phage-related minor tail protein
MSQEQTLEVEILPPVAREISAELNAPQDKVLTIWSPFAPLFARGAELLAKEPSVTTPAEARALRLEMKKHRSACTQAKDIGKADVLLVGRLIDAFYRRAITPLEACEGRLDEIEKAEERRIAAAKEALRKERLAALAEFGMDGASFPLGEMLEEPWQNLLNGAKLAYEAKLAAEAKAKEEARIAAEKAEEERLARIAAEKAERERILAEKAKAEAEAAKARAEAAAAAEKARKALEEEREKARVAAEQARKEREALEAQARKEREAAEAQARIEREKAAKAAQEAERLRKAEQARLAAEKAEADRIAAEKAEAERLAAAAPDLEKLKAVAEKIKGITLPAMATPAGVSAMERIEAQMAALLDAIRAEYKSLSTKKTAAA